MGKVEVRKQVISLIQSLSELEKQRQSEMVLRQVIAHHKYRSAKTLAVYLSTTNEINTKPILQHALEVEHKNCYIPLIRKTMSKKTSFNETRMVMVRLDSMAHYERLPLNRYGIKEPVDEYSMDKYSFLDPCQPACNSPVLFIVPGVAFTGDGRRLGHGKGYYDEFLHHWSSRCNTGFYTLGLAFLEQLVEDPCAIEGQDYPLDQVLTATV